MLAPREVALCCEQRLYAVKFSSELKTELRGLIVWKPTRHLWKNNAMITLRAPVPWRGVARCSGDGKNFDEFSPDFLRIDGLLARHLGKEIGLAAHALCVPGKGLQEQSGESGDIGDKSRIAPNAR
jgi:hypothetical protein